MSERQVGRFTLRVLGTPELTAPDGRRVSSVLSQPKRLGLLTYLALSPAPVSRATLVATFWPESDEARGRNALSQALHHLRRALGDGVVESVEPDRLQVSMERLWCDAREVVDGRASPTAGLGELMEGWTADDAAPLQAWLDAQRQRLREVGPQETGSAVPSAASAPAPAPARPRQLRLAWAALAVLVSASVIVTAGRVWGGQTTADLAVLLPRVFVAEGAVALDPQVILDEVLAHLPERDGVRIRPAPSASSVPDFRTQLATIGAVEDDAPAWILEVSVRVTPGEVGVVGLLYRSPALTLPGRESFGVPYDSSPSATLSMPREIARGIAAMVERALQEE